MSLEQTKRIGVLTSGGDAQGMNAAVRAVARIAMARGAEVYAVLEGYQGMVDGGARIRRMVWDEVGGILHKGGTIIGTARCDAFRSRPGRLQAAHNLLQNGVDNLIVIGGDGSLCGAALLHQEWAGLLSELVSQGVVTREQADRHPHLTVVGLVGSIDNDMLGTDMTIGADSALHRITEAVDAISSTAASHQRAFVVEVMGRHCGYLALMGALASGADWVLIPESPPDVENWEERMCEVLKAGRSAGRRDSIVIVAEGARDRNGKPIESAYVRQVLAERLGEDVRVTILGHVQRGGAPSAFDRNLSTLLGAAAVDQVFSAASGKEQEPCLIGIRGNRVVCSPLQACVEQTHRIAKAMEERDFATALSLRGNNFQTAFRTIRTLVRALPHPPAASQRRWRLAVMHSGAPAPGMNTAVRAAVRLGVDLGHLMFGVKNGFHGLISGDLVAMDWMSVNGWAPMGGAELGTNRKELAGKDLYAIARTLEEQQIEGLLMIGGWSGYEAMHRLWRARENFPAFNIPLICLPATIDNDSPGSDLSVGADTALNCIVDAVDKIKQSAVASRRCFVVEVMGNQCGYLAQMSGLATGAERVYLPEEGVTLADLQTDLDTLTRGFQQGKRLSVMIRNELAHPLYTTNFMATLFAGAGGDLFAVRQAILGHLQQGGNPTPFDRILAMRFAAACIERLIAQAEQQTPAWEFVGFHAGQLAFHNLEDLPRMMDVTHQRPKEQWWLDVRSIAKVLAQPGPNVAG